MKRKLLLTVSHILTAALAAFVTLMLCAPESARFSKLEELEDLILERFIGEADTTAMEDAAAHGMISALDDRWSYYIPASEYAAHVEQSENAYVGIGITIQQAEDGSGLLVMKVNEGGPAEEAGFRVGDILAEVEGQSTANMTTTETRNLVRGKEGTYVNLTILRDGERINLDVERRRVLTPVAEGVLLESGAGLVSVYNFDDRCAEESIAAVEDLLAQGARALIFDVRYNPGGYAHEMVALLDYLLPEGDLFRTVNYAGKENVDRSDADCLDIPLAVLVNADSYSAAEFFAAALMEYEAATVVGTRTSGKGHFQNTFQLSDGSAVGLSVGKYFTPNGECLEGVGIVPHVELPLGEEQEAALYYGNLLPEEDPQVQAAEEVLGLR